MTPSNWFVLSSFLLFFLGERTFGTNMPVRVVLLGLAALLLVWGLIDRVRRMKASSAEGREAHRKALVLLGVALGGVLVYVLTLDGPMGVLSLGEEAARKWKLAMGAACPILVFSGLVPMFFVDRAISASPIRPHPLRVRGALEGGLVAVFALGLLFPLNYLAKEFNKRWDVTYFRTTAPGQAVTAIVENLNEPVQAVMFFDASSEVEREVRPYFENLAAAGSNFSVTVADNAVDPELARKYKIRDNGSIALVMGDKSEVVKIGTDFDKAKKTLKKLDAEVQKALMKVTRGDRVAYFTVGHGEMGWQGQAADEQKASNLKKLLEALNFKVKELGLGQGLANEVPDDASVVFTLAPEANFLPEEVAAIGRYLDHGGRVFVALNPVEDESFDPSPLLGRMGLRFHPDLIITDEEKAYLPGNRGLSDRQNIGTNRYSSHESVTTLSRNSSKSFVLLPGTGSLESLPDTSARITMVVRSLVKCWADKNGNFEFDKDTESRKSWDLVAAVSGNAEGGPEYRAIVSANARFLSDPFLPYQPNAILTADSLHWLVGEPEITGTTNTEEDVKIVHSKENQRIWFYGSTFLAPLALAGLGLIRVLQRRQKGVA